MPLDSSIFSYLVEGITKHVISTAHREDGQFKYKFGTPKEVLETMMLVWNADNDGGREGPVTSEKIIKDIDKVRTSIIKIIQHHGTVVRELDNRVGRRKDAVRARLTDSLAPEALKGLEEQLAASAGMSGPADAELYKFR